MLSSEGVSRGSSLWLRAQVVQADHLHIPVPINVSHWVSILFILMSASCVPVPKNTKLNKTLYMQLSKGNSQISN